MPTWLPQRNALCMTAVHPFLFKRKRLHRSCPDDVSALLAAKKGRSHPPSEQQSGDSQPGLPTRHRGSRKQAKPWRRAHPPSSSGAESDPAPQASGQPRTGGLRLQALGLGEPSPPGLAHTHTHTTHTLSAHSHTHTQPSTYTLTRTHWHPHALSTHTHTHAFTFSHSHHTYTLAWTQTLSHSLNTLSHTHIHTHPTLTHSQRHTLSRHSHTYTLTHSHTLSPHTYMHALLTAPPNTHSPKKSRKHNVPSSAPPCEALWAPGGAGSRTQTGQASLRTGVT